MFAPLENRLSQYRFVTSHGRFWHHGSVKTQRNVFEPLGFQRHSDYGETSSPEITVEQTIFNVYDIWNA